MELQGLVGDMKQHQDRLLDTAAHLSNELSVNQEHLKVHTCPLYTCTLVCIYAHYPVCTLLFPHLLMCCSLYVYVMVFRFTTHLYALALLAFLVVMMLFYK